MARKFNVTLIWLIINVIVYGNESGDDDTNDSYNNSSDNIKSDDYNIDDNTHYKVIN